MVAFWKPKITAIFPSAFACSMWAAFVAWTSLSGFSRMRRRHSASARAATWKLLLGRVVWMPVYPERAMASYSTSSHS